MLPLLDCSVLCVLMVSVRGMPSVRVSIHLSAMCVSLCCCLLCVGALACLQWRSAQLMRPESLLCRTQARLPGVTGQLQVIQCRATAVLHMRRNPYCNCKLTWSWWCCSFEAGDVIGIGCKGPGVCVLGGGRGGEAGTCTGVHATLSSALELSTTCRLD